MEYQEYDNLKEDQVLPNVFRVGCYKDKKDGPTDTFPFRKTVSLDRYRDIGEIKRETLMAYKCYNYLKDLMYINTHFAIRGKTCFYGPDRVVKYNKYGRSTGCKLDPFHIKLGSLFVYKWNV
ncbi:uncharacterized protein LOC130647733 [Hydractinia symbiolongicarpus]|uniref:uncharacterized protein LOC130647733 n=1 Tax=Hydractinia symbiolongicarpus TaxID=13093 RepID=UPI00254C96DD|nr:uncharacterized protein LOC130647733 [Hydractinia symbiolongicarpus]